MDDTIRTVGERLAAARGVVVVTGAGVSAESHIPTFRDTMTGLWAEFDPETLATPEAFAADPETVTRWYDARRLGCLHAEPNPGHLALAEIERKLADLGGKLTLLTQNVDGLHLRAGSRRVAELHGSLHRWRCTKTGKEVRPGPEAFEVYPPPSPFAEDGVLRPSVVWFGEHLPEQALRAADEALWSCDLFLSVGTSSLVFPSAGWVHLASARGAATVEVNPEETPITREMDCSLRGKSGEVMPRVLDAMLAAL